MRRLLVVGLGVGASVALRLPAWLSQVSLGYDDGVYGASTNLMASGLLPFRDFFSSQGPVFLPFLRGFDILGIGGMTAPRLAMVFAGAAVTLLMYLILRRDSQESTALAMSLVVATSGILVLAAGRLHSEGPALALGLAAVLVATGRAHPLRKSAAAGALVALALATKSLHLVPTTAVVFVLLWREGRWRSTGVAAGFACVTGLLVSVPFGLGHVWDQYVRFHIQKTTEIDSVENLVGIHELLWQLDLPLMVLVALAVLALVVRPRARSGGDRLPTSLLWVWLGLSVGLLVFLQPVVGGFERFAAILIPPVALLVARAPIHRSLVIAIAVTAVVFQWLVLPTSEIVRPSVESDEVSAVLSSIPEDSYVVTDEPGLVWFADRLSHPETVDSSFGRIGAGSITIGVVEAALIDQRTCALISWSGRFAALGLEDPPIGFERVWEDEDRYVAVRSGC